MSKNANEPTRSTTEDLEFRLSASGSLVLAYADALRAIAELTQRGMRLEHWEGQVVLTDGTRARSLWHGGSFALSREPARAASVATAGITKARESWDRKPEYVGAELQFRLSFART